MNSPTSRQSWPAWVIEASFPLPHGRGDQVRHGGSGPDPREFPPKGLRSRREDAIRERLGDWETYQLRKLRRRRIVTCTEAMEARDGRWLEAAGLVLVRQRPGSAQGVMFITLEDKTGVNTSKKTYQYRIPRPAFPLFPASIRTTTSNFPSPEEPRSAGYRSRTRTSACGEPALTQ
jgi:hypothetical protein